MEEGSEMNSKKWMWLSVLMLVSMLISSACAKATPTPTEEAGPVSISFVTHDFEPWRNTMIEWIGEYMDQHPGVEISYVTYPMTDMVTKLVTGFEAGAGDTVMGIYGPWLAAMAEGGYLDEAPSWVMDMLKDDFYDIAVDAGSYKGKLVGVLQHIGTPLPLLNVDTYEAAGISEDQYPQSYDDLLALIPKLDKKDASGSWEVQAICLPPTDVFVLIDWATVLFAHGGKILDDSLTKAAFNTPEGLAATQVYKQIHYPDADINLFPLSKCGMWWYGSWSRPMFTAQNPNIRVKVLEPLEGPAGRVHANYAWIWVVNANATPRQKEVAWDFIKYITRPEAQITFWNVVGVMPTRKSVYEDPAISADEFVQAFGKYVNETRVYYPPLPDWEPVEKALIRYLERLVAGELTEQQFLDQAEKEVNSLLTGQ
jgi:multiple sugar transport system substrate-binding protein